MSLPGNGIFVLRGEISTLMTAIKRGTRWNSSNYQVIYFDFNFVSTELNIFQMFYCYYFKSEKEKNQCDDDNLFFLRFLW